MFQMWSLKITGGQAFWVHPEGCPAISHDGTTTVQNILLDEGDAKRVVQWIETHAFCKVTLRPLESQTEEQHEERKALLGMGKEDKVWPSPACPSCYWFDPRNDNPRGYEVFESEVVDQSLKSHDAARESLAMCPIHGETNNGP